MRKKITTEMFIEKIKKIFKDKYDYSKVNYVDYLTPICLIDAETNEEKYITPKGLLKHYQGDKILKMTTEEFIQKAKAIHGDKYDYSKTKYYDYNTNVIITCPIHGDFEQKPNSHLQGCGCKKCNYKLINKKRIYNNEIFVKKAKEVHGDKYDYSKINYVNKRTKVCIICPEHGEFWQNPSNHLNGNGCPVCKLEKSKLTTEKFIEKAKAIHGDKYDYSKVDYKNNTTKVCIICPVHGEFWQVASYHLCGSGCPSCSESKGEKMCAKFLKEQNICFERQKKMEWLGNQRLDFYLSDYNVAIEYQGRQHYVPIDFAGRGKKVAEKLLNDNIERDKRKKEICTEHGLKIFYIKYDENITEKLKSLLLEILNEK